MPLYEYKCASCGKTFEVIQKFADEPLKTHPECGGEVVRLFSAPAFHLKGTGWYATDYAKKSNGSDSKDRDSKDKDSKDKEAKSGESKSGESKSDTNKFDSKSSTENSSSSTETKPAASSESKPSTPATTTT
jgi:putative FmdB family regulatory protein